MFKRQKAEDVSWQDGQVDSEDHVVHLVAKQFAICKPRK